MRPVVEKPTLHVFFELARLMGRRLHAHFERLGLHRGQAFLLGRLWHGDGIGQSELARDVHLRAPTVTRMLARMEQAGWIERRHDAHDRRVSRVFLTPRARGLRGQFVTVMADLEEEMLAELTASERRTLHHLLRKIHTRALTLQSGVGGDEARKGHAA
jgi:DNA-binding MarR family transcriptional regulator